MTWIRYDLVPLSLRLVIGLNEIMHIRSFTPWHVVKHSILFVIVIILLITVIVLTLNLSNTTWLLGKSADSRVTGYRCPIRRPLPLDQRFSTRDIFAPKGTFDSGLRLFFLIMTVGGR